ncbi:uncharacterized protein [Haliotis asinina]|uniref:uncharacterized protein n=1 Tax=Haliotis asinina TaxID=109174 RepID=UPI003531CFDE
MEPLFGLLLLCWTFRTSANLCGYVQLHKVDQQQRYHFLSDFNDLNMTTPQRISELPSKTQQTCAHACHSNNNCTMFNININDGQCLLYSASFPSVINSGYLDGARLYVRESDTCPIPEGYIAFDNPPACYRLSLNKTNWADATAACAIEGGHLVVMEDVAKFQQVMVATADFRDLCTVAKCSGHCRCNAACVVINFNTATSVCQLHDASVLNNNATVEENMPEWVILEPQNGAPKFGEWTLVFRATAGINQSALEEYMNSTRRDDQYTIVNKVPTGCLSLNGSIPCDRQYRTRHLETWDHWGVSQVLLGLYKDGDTIGNVTFDCNGCSVTSWFERSHVIASSWNDLMAPETTTNLFSIEGHGNRHFVINEIYLTCDTDQGWLTVIDHHQSVGCPWEEHTTSFPYILVSAEETSTNWTYGNPVAADVMAIMVKL